MRVIYQSRIYMDYIVQYRAPVTTFTKPKVLTILMNVIASGSTPMIANGKRMLRKDTFSK